MKTVLAVVVFLLFAAVTGGTVQAQAFDPVGRYDFTLTDSRIKGTCPMGQDNSGSLSIVKTAGGYALTYVQGMVCSPPKVCHLPGQCRGNECTFSTTVPVDNEGGKVTNSAKLRFEGRGATGRGRSVYRHPSGYQCTWDYKITMTR